MACSAEASMRHGWRAERSLRVVAVTDIEAAGYGMLLAIGVQVGLGALLRQRLHREVVAEVLPRQLERREDGAYHVR